MASFSVGILVGPAIGSVLSPLAATYGACACGLLCIVYVYFVVPESLSPEAMQEVGALASACLVFLTAKSAMARYRENSLYYWFTFSNLKGVLSDNSPVRLFAGAAAAG